MKSLSVLVAGLFFTAFALVHLVRIFQTWEVTFAGNVIPMWASYLAAPVSALLAFGLLKPAKKPD